MSLSLYIVAAADITQYICFVPVTNAKCNMHYVMANNVTICAALYYFELLILGGA